MKKIILTIIILPLVAYCQSFVPNAPELNLKSYILLEPNTNTVIAEFNSDELIETNINGTHTLLKMLPQEI